MMSTGEAQLAVAGRAVARRAASGLESARAAARPTAY